MTTGIITMITTTITVMATTTITMIMVTTTNMTRTRSVGLALPALARAQLRAHEPGR